MFLMNRIDQKKCH